MRILIWLGLVTLNTAHAENNWNVFCDASHSLCGVGQYLVATEDAKTWLKVSFHERDSGDIQMYWIMPPAPNLKVVIIEDGEYVADATMTNCNSQYCDAHFNFSGEAKDKLFKTKEIQIGVVVSENDAVSIPFDTTDLREMLIKARPNK